MTDKHPFPICNVIEQKTHIEQSIDSIKQEILLLKDKLLVNLKIVRNLYD